MTATQEILEFRTEWNKGDKNLPALVEFLNKYEKKNLLEESSVIGVYSNPKSKYHLLMSLSGVVNLLKDEWVLSDQIFFSKQFIKKTK